MKWKNVSCEIEDYVYEYGPPKINSGLSSSRNVYTRVLVSAGIYIYTYKIKKRQVWDRGFRRNSSLQAAWDTSIARTTGFMWTSSKMFSPSWGEQNLTAVEYYYIWTDEEALPCTRYTSSRLQERVLVDMHANVPHVACTLFSYGMPLWPYI